jgi:hypothetical protein
MYGSDGHIRLSKCMVRNSEFIYATNYYPQQCESGERPPDMKMWKTFQLL